MKKIALAILLALTLVATLVACNNDPVSNIKPEFGSQTTSYTINGVPFSPSTAENARLEYDGIADLVFSFTIPREHYEHLSEECTDLSITATFTDGEELLLPAAVIDLGYVGDARVIEAALGGVFVENYLTEYSVTLATDFIDETGKKQSILTIADKATVYDVAYLEYCDRDDVPSERYPYPTDYGFSPYADLSERYAILASAIRLVGQGTTLRNGYECSAYLSPYSIEYFDGVLTVAMRNGAEINPNLLRHITFGGESIYFEIYKGIIRVVLEVSE